MSKKSTISSPLKRPSTRSLSSTKAPHQQDKYAFQSDDEDYHTKPVLVRKSATTLLSKRPRARPSKPTPKGSSNSSSSSDIDEKKPLKKRSYEKPVTRRASRLVSQTNTSVSQLRDKIKINSTPPTLITPKKRGRRSNMLSASTPLAGHGSPDGDDQHKTETENRMPSPSPNKRRLNKPSAVEENNNAKPSADDKEPVQSASPLEHDDFSDDSVEFTWKGSSKMSIEILKRRMPKDEARDHYSSSASQPDPTAQRKRAIIPRLTNFDALSGQPVDNATSNHTKPPSSVITLNNAFQNDFDYSYSDKGTKMVTTNATGDDKPRPRVYAVKSTTMKARPQQASPSDIKRPKWMNNQQGKPAANDDDAVDHPSPTAGGGEEITDYEYMPKGQYVSKRPSYRARGAYVGRRGTGQRGRPPGSRRYWNNEDDDDDDYDQYEGTNARYGPRRPSAYRSTRPMYDMVDNNNDDEYEKSRRTSLTQAYRRNSDIRQPMANANRRMPMNNGNHAMYKDDNYYSSQQTRPITTANRLPTTTSAPIHSGNTFVAKINDAQLSEVANQSQIFFVNVPQHDQKNQQVLSVLASEQQQVLPVAVMQQAKVETSSSMNNTAGASQNQTLAFTVKLPVDTPKQKKILPKPSSTSNSATTANNNKPFQWSRPPGRVSTNNDDQSTGKGLTITPINTDHDTMEAAHVLATAADVTMAADARRKAQQHDDDMAMMVDDTPSNVTNEETVQCEEDEQKHHPQQMGTITANIIDENGQEHTVILSTEEAQQLLGSQGAIIVDGDGQPISIQQAQPQTFLSPFALDQAQLQALLTQAGIDPNTPLTIEQIDPNQQQQQQQQQQVATICTSPGGTQYTVLTQTPSQQQYILQTAPMNELPVAHAPPPTLQLIAPKEDPSSPPKRRAFAVKSTTPTTAAETFDEINSNDRPRRKIFATKSTVASAEHDDDEEGIIGTRAYHRK